MANNFIALATALEALGESWESEPWESDSIDTSLDNILGEGSWE